MDKKIPNPHDLFVKVTLSNPQTILMRIIAYQIEKRGERRGKKKREKISVVLPIEEHQIILNELEELEDIRLYDEAKATGEPSIPIDKAFKMIEAERKKKK